MYSCLMIQPKGKYKYYCLVRYKLLSENIKCYLADIERRKTIA